MGSGFQRVKLGYVVYIEQRQTVYMLSVLLQLPVSHGKLTYNALHCILDNIKKQFTWNFMHTIIIIIYSLTEIDLNS